ncbi:hypothetical protein ACS0TY_011810 [Phlomoides rotata]
MPHLMPQSQLNNTLPAGQNMESKIPGKQLEENVTSCSRIRQVNFRKKLVAFPKSIQLDMDMDYILRKFTRLRVLDASETSINDLSSKELQILDLGGELEIKHLERVESGMDAKKANLALKKNLCALTLVWERKRGAIIWEGVDEEVLGALEPHPSLETLRIEGFSGLSSEKVMRKLASAAFPKLETLGIESCCSSLILPSFSSLKHLKAVNCGGAALASFSQLESLTSLSVRIDDEEMKCFLVEMLEKLTILVPLTISSAQELLVMEHGLCSFKSLTVLQIQKCEKVRSIPEGWFRHLIALETLFIRECEELVELPDDMRYLQNLKFAMLSGLPKMVGLPKALHHLSSLAQLSIMTLHELNSLPDWLHHLTSLRRVSVYDLYGFRHVSKG